jgi:uncharacterized membrane protein
VTSGPVRPTQDDDVLAGLSDVVGGPAGEHDAGHPWWTPIRVLLVVTAACFALGMVQKAPCYNVTWENGEDRYSEMCYSDLPYLYTGRGFAELNWPYSEDEQVRQRYETMEYPVGISYFAWLDAWATHWLSGSPDISGRAQIASGDMWGAPGVVPEVRLYVVTTALGMAICALVATVFLSGVNRRRPWDALGFAASPALLFTGLVNWDMLAVLCVAGATWAWARGKPVWTGVWLGLGTATKLYPLFLVGALLVICLRERRWLALVHVVWATAVTWLLVNLPAMATGFSQWKVFWTFNQDRGADFGSVWLAVSEATKHTFEVSTINHWSEGFFVVWCLAVAVLGYTAKVTPRFAQLGFLIVAGFLLVNKVYSPQYVLWLLPLAVLARPRWRDLLIWQAGEILYFASVWWYLGKFLASGSDESVSPAYWIAIALRMAAELYLVAVVVRDIRDPWSDPVDRYDDDYPSEMTTRSNVVAV